MVKFFRKTRALVKLAQFATAGNASAYDVTVFVGLGFNRADRRIESGDRANEPGAFSSAGRGSVRDANFNEFPVL